jgi:hypothetical protein
MSEIQELVRKLAAARQVVQDAACARESVEKQIAESELGRQLTGVMSRLSKAKDAEYSAKEDLKQAVLDQFDGANKRPHPAVTVRVSTKYDYDQKTARTWAMEHMHTCMVLDAKKFEDGIAATDIPDFVTVRPEASVAVSTDLSGYLD